MTTPGSTVSQQVPSVATVVPHTATEARPLNRMEIVSIIVTVALLVLLAGIAWLSYRNEWLLVLALAVGGIGGLVHEIAQSRGKILFFRRQSDGLYLGAIAGVALGAVAGILVIRGYVTGDTSTAQTHSAQVCYEVFLAGLALKGVAEAAGTGRTQE